jgi:hypothetical protein
MGRGGNDGDQGIGGGISRGQRDGLGQAFDLARARERVIAQFSAPREVSSRRAASLVASAEGWKVVEIFSDAVLPKKTKLEVADPSDPRQVESAYAVHLDSARSADAAAGFALA